MTTIKEASEKTAVFAREALGKERTRGLRLEEVESASENRVDVWLLTLSMVAPEDLSTFTGGLAQVLGNAKREYKVFTIRKDIGEVLSMKIRELANV